MTTQHDRGEWQPGLVQPPRLMEAAKAARTIYLAAAAVDSDLWGYSLLDLIADNIPAASLADLRAAIVAAGIYPIANARIQAQIAGYR